MNWIEWQSVRGDPEHFDSLVISWQFEHFWANNWQGINNSHRTIKLWFNEEKIFHLIFTTYQNYYPSTLVICWYNSWRQVTIISTTLARTGWSTLSVPIATKDNTERKNLQADATLWFIKNVKKKKASQSKLSSLLPRGQIIILTFWFWTLKCQPYEETQWTLNLYSTKYQLFPHVLTDCRNYMYKGVFFLSLSLFLLYSILNFLVYHIIISSLKHEYNYFLSKLWKPPKMGIIWHQILICIHFWSKQDWYNDLGHSIFFTLPSDRIYAKQDISFTSLYDSWLCFTFHFVYTLVK